MSIILQIGAPHVSCAAPSKRTEAIMGANSEADTVEALDDCDCVPMHSSATPVYPNCFGLPYQFWLQDHNYGAPPPPTPPQSPVKVNGTLDEDTTTSVVTTSTNNEDDGGEKESITRCICEFDHDDEYMICCDKCFVWQHVDCMGLDRNNIPETYMCEKCEPRKVDRQKAKALQTKKREEMTDSSSEESGNENSQFKSTSLPHTTSTLATRKGKKVRRKVREKPSEEKIPNTPTKKTKREKEKLEPRRLQSSRKRRKSKSSEVTPIDEDARDSWDSSVRDYKESYEEADTNQYSPEVHLQISNLKLNGKHEELSRKVSDHHRMHLCKVAEINKSLKKLVAIEDILQNQIICEYRGKFLLLSQFQEQNPVFNHKSHPFVLFYSFHKDQEDVCVDSRDYGNNARFVRRCCTPNAEVRHVVENGSLHLYIVSIKGITQDDEITIPFDFNFENCVEKIDCPCTKASCPIALHGKKNGQLDTNSQDKKSKKVKKVCSTDEESTQPSGIIPVNGQKGHKMSPLHTSQSNNQQQQPNLPAAADDLSLQNDSGLSAVGPALPLTVPSTASDAETEEQAAERRKKMTREERKMEAIIKAFARLEKAQQRRQEALARLAQKKEELELKKKEEEQKKKDEPEEPESKPEEPKPVIENTSASLNVSTPPATTTLDTSVSSDDAKTPAVAKPKGKGKKRKNSGNPVRRRTRMNSGGSDIMSPDESTHSLLSVTSTPSTTPTTTPTPTPTPPACVTIIPAAPTSPVATEVAPPPVLPNANNNGFKFPKTKKLLMTEWLSEKPEPVIQPLTIKTEPPEFTTAAPTCYMRCARSPTGINSAHLRRSSGGSSTSCTKQAPADSSLGSAKKRWLRQAMYEEVSSVEQASPVMPSGPVSPTHRPSSPPCTSPPAALVPDLVTPLKKRRVARESMSSDTTLPSTPPSTPSPSVSGGPNDLNGGEGSGMMCDPDDDEAPLLDLDSSYPASSLPPDECDRLKENIPEPTIYGKAIAFLQKIPQDPSLAKSLENLQDYFKKDPSSSPDICKIEVLTNDAKTLESCDDDDDDEDEVCNTNEIVVNQDCINTGGESCTIEQEPNYSQNLAKGMKCSVKCETSCEICSKHKSLTSFDTLDNAQKAEDKDSDIVRQVRLPLETSAKPLETGSPSISGVKPLGMGSPSTSGVKPLEIVSTSSEVASSSVDSTPALKAEPLVSDDVVETSADAVLFVSCDSTSTGDKNDKSAKETGSLVSSQSLVSPPKVREIDKVNTEMVKEPCSTVQSSVLESCPVQVSLDMMTSRPDSSTTATANVSSSLSSSPISSEQVLLDIISCPASNSSQSSSASSSSSSSSTLSLMSSSSLNQVISSSSVVAVSNLSSSSVVPVSSLSSSSLPCSQSDSKVLSSSSSSASSSNVSEAACEADVSNSQITSTCSVANGLISQNLCSSSSSCIIPMSNSCSQNQTAKRKVSLLEYRKRKLENQCVKEKIPSMCQGSTTAVSSTSVTSPNEPHLDATPPPPRLSTLPLFEATGMVDCAKSSEENALKKDGKKNLEEDVRWNCAPTTLEQQRENLTQRLRREFGLITDEDSDSDKEKGPDSKRLTNRTPPPPPPLAKGASKVYPMPTPANINEVIEEGFVRTQNGRPIGCYPTHPPTPQPTIVRPGASATVVRSIPTIIGITGIAGYQAGRSLPPSVVTAQPSHHQQYSYQQFTTHPGAYPTPSQTSQQALAPPQYATTQIVTQYSGPPPPGQAISTLQLRPPIASPTPCAAVPQLVVPPGSQPPPAALAHVQQQSLIRPTLIQNYAEQHHFNPPPPPPPPRPQAYYSQTYYQ